MSWLFLLNELSFRVSGKGGTFDPLTDNTTITLKAALATLDTGAECSMLVITCNKSKRTGGEELVIDKCTKHNHLTYSEQKRLKRAQPQQPGVRKNPNHYDNSTRNVKCENGELVKVHINLIRKFNGKTVL